MYDRLTLGIEGSHTEFLCGRTCGEITEITFRTVSVATGTVIFEWTVKLQLIAVKAAIERRPYTLQNIATHKPE